MKTVLFVCTANICRSPMAEAIFNALAEDRDLPFRAQSAGTAALEGRAMVPNALALFGKILRINKSGTIPTNNPFYSTASGNNRAIWALGLRNPFKFAVQPGTGTILINDVGQNTWEEINRLEKGANYGWPVHEGVANDPPYVDPIFAYGHDGDPATTGCSITGGTFYNPTAVLFPPEYEGDYFFAEFCGGWISSLDTATGNASGFATGLERPVDLEVSKSGELHYLARGSTGSPALVGKISYASN